MEFTDYRVRFYFCKRTALNSKIAFSKRSFIYRHLMGAILRIVKLSIFAHIESKIQFKPPLKFRTEDE